MPVTLQAIDEAKQQKFSDDEILSVISGESEDFSAKIKQARSKDFSSQEIIDEIRNTFQAQAPSIPLPQQAPVEPSLLPAHEPIEAPPPGLPSIAATPEALPEAPPNFTFGGGRTTGKDKSGSFQEFPGERLRRTFLSGAAQTVGSMLGAVEWLADSDIARDLSKKTRQWARKKAPEDPNFFDQVVQGFGSAAIFFIPGMGISRGAGALANITPRLAAWLGVGVSTALESATEAGSVYQNVLEKTENKQKASKAATNTLLANIPLIAVTNRIGPFADRGGVIKKAVNSALTEAFQEGAQEAIGAIAEERPIEAKRLATAAGVGAIVGAPLGAIGGIPTQQVSQPLVETPPPLVAQETPINPDVTTPPSQQEMNSFATGTETTAGINPSELRTNEPNETIGKEEIIKRSTIVKNLDKAFAPIRVGKFRSKKGIKSVLGIFKVTPEVIRTKRANDINTVTHEVGHAIHKQYFSAPGTKILSGTPFNNWKNELDPLAYQGADDATIEGFAEFVRFYVTNPSHAKEQAPNFFTEFDNVLARDMPEIKDVLHKARNDFERWNNLSSVAKIKSQISIDEAAPPSDFTFDKFYTAMVDKFHPLEEAVKEITKGNENLEGADLYKLARLYQGVHGKADTFLTYKPFKFADFSFHGKGLKEILQPFNKKKELDNLRIYAVAKRTLELARRGKRSGITVEDARKAIIEIERQGVIDKKDYSQTFKALDEYQNSVLEYLRDSGVLSNKSFLKIKSLNKSYIPFYRVMETQRPGLGQKGFADLFNPVKRLTREGSDREIIDPLESVIKNTYAFIKKAEQNRVGLELLKLSQQDKSGRFVERLPTPVKPIPITNKEIYAIFDKYGNWKETTTFKKFEKEFIKKSGIKDGVLSKPMQKLESIVRDSLVSRGMTKGEADVFVEKLKGAKSSGKIKELIEKTIEKQTIIHTFKELELDIPEVINVFRPTAYSKSENIVTVFQNGKPVSLQLDPELYKAVLQLDRQDVNLLTKILRFPAKTLRAGATALSLEFAARNPLRDQFTAFVFSKFGFKPGIDFTRGLFHMLARDEVFHRFKQSGAEHSMLVSLDRDYFQKDIKDLVRRGPAPNKILNPLELLRTLSEWSEMGTRVGEFNRGIKELGVSDRKAIETAGLAAREVGLDFARMGVQMRSLNMITAFQNAAIQGLDKPVRAFKDHPGRTWGRILAGITIPSILLWFVNKDDEEIQELPQWQRDLFWVFKPPQTAAQIAGIDPNTIFRIPKPFEMGILFGSFPERILDWMETNDPKGLEKISKTFIEGAIPPLIPTAAVPLIENYANRSIFLDRPIIKRGREELAPPFQHGPFASELSKILGKQLNYSPAKIDNIFRGWFAGAGRLGVDAIDKFLEEFNIVDLPPAPDPTLADIPLVRAFVARNPSANTESIRDFYEIYNEEKQFMDTGKFLLKNKRGEEGREWIIENSDLVLTRSKLKLIETTAKRLGGLRNFIDEINNSRLLDPSEKRRRIDNAYRSMGRMAKGALNILKRKK